MHPGNSPLYSNVFRLPAAPCLAEQENGEIRGRTWLRKGVQIHAMNLFYILQSSIFLSLTSPTWEESEEAEKYRRISDANI